MQPGDTTGTGGADQGPGWRRRAGLVAVALLGLVAAGCGSGSGSSGATASTITIPLHLTTTIPTAPTSTAPRPHLVLGPDGLGAVNVGDPEAQVVATVTQALISSPKTLAGVCPGTTEEEWSDLAVEFSGGVMTGYRYLRGGFPTGGTTTTVPKALQDLPPIPWIYTATGATLGSPLAVVKAQYPKADFTTEQGGAVTVAGTQSGDRLFLGFFSTKTTALLAEVKGGHPCGDV